MIENILQFYNEDGLFIGARVEDVLAEYRVRFDPEHPNDNESVLRVSPEGNIQVYETNNAPDIDEYFPLFIQPKENEPLVYNRKKMDPLYKKLTKPERKKFRISDKTKSGLKTAGRVALTLASGVGLFVTSLVMHEFVPYITELAPALEQVPEWVSHNAPQALYTMFHLAATSHIAKKEKNPTIKKRKKWQAAVETAYLACTTCTGYLAAPLIL